jgi:hypothetical protein
MTKESDREGMGTTTRVQGSTTVVRSSKQDSIITDLVRVPRPTRAQVVWTIRITVVVVVALFSVLLLLYTISRRDDVTLMGLLRVLAIPITLGAVVPLLSWLQTSRERKIATDIEEARRERELEVEDQRAQHESLQAYIDQIGLQLLDKDRPLLKSATASEVRTETDADEVRTLARARTLTVLPRLNSERKRSVLQFIYEANLVIKGHVVVALRGADLTAADLSAANLSAAHLSAADLSRASLDAADLREAELRDADLSDASLSAANLHGADLGGADLRRAYLHATNLLRANLSAVDLSGPIRKFVEAQ